MPEQGVPPREPSPDPGSLLDLLERLRLRIPVESIDELWIFPTRKLGGADSTVLVVASFEPGDERRRVLTARYTATPDPKGQVGVTESVVEHGIAPHDRIGRVVEGVLRRLGEDLDAPSRHARIAGEPARWTRLVSALAPRDAS